MKRLGLGHGVSGKGVRPSHSGNVSEMALQDYYDKTSMVSGN